MHAVGKAGAEDSTPMCAAQGGCTEQRTEGWSRYGVHRCRNCMDIHRTWILGTVWPGTSGRV